MVDSTVIETYDVDFGDNNLPVLCNDGANICSIGTDFIFDALNPAGYASGVLPATGAVIGTVVNLARDVAPAISAVITRTGTVTGIQRTTGFTATTFDGKGWQMGGTGTPKSPIQLAKTGIAANRVNEASLEGFASVLELVWARITDFSDASGTILFGNGQGGGSTTNMNVYANGVTGDLRATVGSSNIALGKTVVLNELVQAGIHSKFNVDGTTTLTPIINGVLGTPVAGPAWPGTFVANNGFALAQLGLMPGYPASDNAKTIYRAVREYTDISQVDVAAFVAKDYAYGLPRFT